MQENNPLQEYLFDTIKKNQLFFFFFFSRAFLSLETKREILWLGLRGFHGFGTEWREEEERFEGGQKQKR